MHNIQKTTINHRKQETISSETGMVIVLVVGIFFFRVANVTQSQIYKTNVSVSIFFL